MPTDLRDIVEFIMSPLLTLMGIQCNSFLKKIESDSRRQKTKFALAIDCDEDSVWIVNLRTSVEVSFPVQQTLLLLYTPSMCKIEAV